MDILNVEGLRGELWTSGRMYVFSMSPLQPALLCLCAFRVLSASTHPCSHIPQSIYSHKPTASPCNDGHFSLSCAVPHGHNPLSSSIPPHRPISPTLPDPFLHKLLRRTPLPQNSL